MKKINVNGNVVGRLEEALEVLKKLEAGEIEEFDFSKLGISFKYREYEIEMGLDPVSTNDEDYSFFELNYNIIVESNINYEECEECLIEEIKEKIKDSLNEAKLGNNQKKRSSETIMIELEDYYTKSYIHDCKLAVSNHKLVSKYYLEDLFEGHFSDLSYILDDFDIDLEYEYENFTDYDDEEDKKADFISHLKEKLAERYNEEKEREQESYSYERSFFTDFRPGYYKVLGRYFADFDFDIDNFASYEYAILEDLIYENDLKGYKKLNNNQKESNYFLLDNTFYSRKKLLELLEEEVFLDNSIVAVRKGDLLDYNCAILSELIY